MVDGFTKTPRYVLKDGSHPTCPSILQTPSDSQISVIFGFSDKPEYDLFLSTSSLALTPYPLVKTFLVNQSEHGVGSLKLIVLDAASAQQRILHAATFQSVLESFQLFGSDFVAISHQLVREGSSSTYHVHAYDVATSELSGRVGGILR